MNKPLARVLIVDDEVAILNLFVRAFRKELEIATATNGSDAIEILEKQDFDLMLVDYSMCKMNGVELAQRAAELRPCMTRVFVTAHYELLEVRRAVAQQLVAAVIAKPWTPRELLAQLLSLLPDKSPKS